jgi:uncharacterized glyoxalase superfamily protein PhnB
MPTLDTHRKQAKLLLRWHQERNYSIGERIRRLDRFRMLTDREALALDFTLAIAQEIVAVEAGFQNWAQLKAAVADAEKQPRAPSGAQALKNVVPILLVRDVSASAAFFRDTLDFTIDFLHGAPPFYGSVSRDSVCLHLRFVREPYFSQLAAKELSLVLATIEVADVHALFEEWRTRGAAFAQTLKTEPWGGTTFSVRDLDGNVLSFVTYREP